MTRVWSLSREETNENQLYVVWKKDSKLLSFDSGYESSFNSQSTLEFDTNFDAFAESDDYSNVNEENRVSEEEESTETMSFLEQSSQQRVTSSPIPIPRRNKNYGNHKHSKNSVESHRSGSSFTSLSTPSSLESIGSVHCLIGHPPYDCGCVRGYRYPFGAQNLFHSSHQSHANPVDSVSLTCAERREGADTTIEAKKLYYPLPDIISSSQNTTLMNEIIREIGCDLRRISKDFIATRNPSPNSQSPKTSAITRLLSLAIPTFIKEVLQLF